LLPFHCTTELDKKFEPFTVSVKAGPPTTVVAGERPPIAGVGLLMVKVELFELPPPGAGLTTVMGTFPPAAISLAEIWAVSTVELLKVVVRMLPFHCTVEDEMKLLPFTVSVNAAPPAVALLGEIEVIAGMGFGVGGGGFEEAEEPPPHP